MNADKLSKFLISGSSLFQQSSIWYWKLFLIYCVRGKGNVKSERWRGSYIVVLIDSCKTKE